MLWLSLLFQLTLLTIYEINLLTHSFVITHKQKVIFVCLYTTLYLYSHVDIIITSQHLPIQCILIKLWQLDPTALNNVSAPKLLRLPLPFYHAASIF